MKLTSLKLTPKEAKGEYDGPATMPARDKGPRYPYVMELRLDTETLDKLGLDLSKFKVGETCAIEAKAIVTRISESQMQGGKDSRNLELQVTDIAITEDKAAKKAKAADKHLEAIASPTRGAPDSDY